MAVAAQRTQEEEERRQTAMKVEDGDDEDEEGGLTFDETSEFVQAVGNNPIVKPKAEVKESKLSNPTKELQQLSRSRDVSMAPGDVTIDELEAGEVRVKAEDDDYDMNMNMLAEIEDALKQTETEEAAATARANDAALGVGTSSEQTFSSGMASTLNILRQQGILAQPTSDQMSREKTQKQHLWLAEQWRRVTQRELEKQLSRGW
jgi:U4/U6.U5 tri-snRNP-associated protein 1